MFNLNDIKNLPYANQFKKMKGAIKLVRFNSNYDKVFAIHYKDKNELRFMSEINLKKNDKLIDEHDNVYFVEEVIIEQPFTIKLENGFLAGEKEFNTIIVKYTKKQIDLPNTLKQCVSIHTNINIDAKGSTFDGGLANYNINQNATYNQLFDFLKLLCNNTYNVKELQPFLSGIQSNITANKPIEEKWFVKFFKFMGTQLLDISKQFLAAYAAALLTK